jgi:hypothetical protein
LPKPPRKEPGPADAIGALHGFLVLPEVTFDKSAVANDVAALRAAFLDDRAFTKVLFAIVRELERAGANPTNFGVPLEFALGGCRKSSFSIHASADLVDLRIVFVPSAPGIKIVAFGHRYDPTSIYFRAAKRV